MLQAPRRIPQGLSLVTASLSPRVVTDHRQVQGDVAFLRTFPGLGGPLTLCRVRQGRGAGRASRCGGLFPALDCGPEAGPRTGDQVLDAPHTVKAAIAQQERDPNAQRAQPCQPGPQDIVHGLLGPHTAHGQGIAAAPDHGVGGGRGAKGGGATLGFAAAALILMGLLYGPVVGQGDHINGHTAPAFAQALGHQLGQEIIALAFERIKGAELGGQDAQHSRPRGSARKLLTGLRDRQPGGGRTDQDPQQGTTVNGARLVQGQCVERGDGAGVHVLTLQGILRRRRHGTLQVA